MKGLEKRKTRKLQMFLEIAVTIKEYQKLADLLAPNGDALLVVAGRPLQVIYELGFGEEWEAAMERHHSTPAAIYELLRVALHSARSVFGEAGTSLEYDEDLDAALLRHGDLLDFEDPAEIMPNIFGYKPDLREDPHDRSLRYLNIE